MKGRTFVKKILAKYKWLLIALLMLSMIAVPMVVNILFKFSSTFSAEWSAGDALAYVSGFQALLGTIILGIITVEQGQDAQRVNERLSEENKEIWDDDLAGVAVVMHLTNTTISGTTFSEYIEFGMQNNGHCHTNYGESLKQTGQVKLD